MTLRWSPLPEENSDCDLLQDEYPGLAIDQVPNLRDRVSEIRTDPKTWTTIYRCRVCGQLWEEKYEQKGHGEVPTVRKSAGSRLLAGSDHYR